MVRQMKPSAKVIPFALMVTFFGSGCSFAQTTNKPYSYAPISPMQTGLGITSATTLTVPAGAIYAIVCAESQNVRYTTDGLTTPTSTTGMLLLQNQCVALQGSIVINDFQAIQASATATLDVSYFK